MPWNDDTLIFGTLTGKYKDERSVNRFLKRICKKIDINHHSTHDMRHSFVTRAFEEGLSIKEVQRLTGDNSVDVLMDVYAHVTDERQLTSMQKIYKNNDDHFNV